MLAGYCQYHFPIFHANSLVYTGINLIGTVSEFLGRVLFCHKFSLTLQRAQNVGGCVQKFKPLHNGNYTFDGSGFVEFDLNGEGTSGFRRTELSFATLEENGLIFLGTNPPQNIGGIAVSNPISTFSALEMKDGYLVSKFDFGNGFKTYVHTATGKLNDGKTHTFLMRVKSKAFLKFLVDGKTINKTDITTDTTDLRYGVSEVFTGGVPMQYEMPHP